MAATLSAMAQGGLAGYEFWIDSGYDSRVAGVGNGDALSLDIDISQAFAGIHYLNFRGRNSQQEWGPVYRYLFFVSPSSAFGIARYEYWLDGAYDSKTVALQATDTLSTVVDLGNLTEGIHYYNIRCQNAEGEWGPLYRYVFFMSEGIPATTLTYWIDDEADAKTWKGEGDEFVVQTDISHLSPGRHVFHCQVLNNETSQEYAYEFMVSDINFDGLVLTVAGDVNMTEAMEQVGGRERVTASVAAVVWNSNEPLTQGDLQDIGNPNLLVYVNNNSQVPENHNNVVVNGVAREIVLADTNEGNNNFFAPQPFVAESISYTRNFEQQTKIGISRGWETIALPFDVQSVRHEQRGDIAPFGSSVSDKHFWLRRLSPEGLQQDTQIEANTPYVISMPNSEEYVTEYNLPGRVTFSSANITVPATEPKVQSLANSSIEMVPTTVAVARSPEVWALNVGQAHDGYPEGSVFVRDYREVRPFEAYVVHHVIISDSDNPSPQLVSIQKLMDQVATGIQQVDDGQMMADGMKWSGDGWWTLDGRKLQGKPTKKGVYIQNGRKQVIP